MPLSLSIFFLYSLFVLFISDSIFNISVSESINFESNKFVSLLTLGNSIYSSNFFSFLLLF